MDQEKIAFFEMGGGGQESRLKTNAREKMQLFRAYIFFLKFIKNNVYT